MGDKRIEVDFTGHRVFNHTRQLCTPFHPTERRTAPYAPGHQLERTGFDLLARTGNADNHALTPAFVTTLKRRTHHVDVADTFEAEVHAAIGELNDHILNRLIIIIRVNKIGRAHLFGEGEFFRVGINRQNAPGFRLYCALNDRQTNPAEAKHRHGIALFDLRGVVNGTDTGGHAAAQQTDFIQRRLRVHLRQ